MSFLSHLGATAYKYEVRAREGRGGHTTSATPPMLHVWPRGSGLCFIGVSMERLRWLPPMSSE